MALPAIIKRELVVATRKYSPAKGRFWGSAVVVAVIIFFLLLASFGGYRSWGKDLHGLMFFCGLFVAVIRPIYFTVGLFSEERRNQTLELLFLTGITPRELFASKLLGGLLIASSDLLALMPFLAIPFLSGGLSFDIFIATLACLPTLLVFVFSLGILGSVICRDESTAFVFVMSTAAAISLLTPLPYNLGITLGGAAPFSSSWLLASPAYAPWIIINSFGTANAVDFWPAIACTLLFALINLWIASGVLSRNWRQQLITTGVSGRTFLGRWFHQQETLRKARQRIVLSRNPFAWLTRRSPRPIVLAWASVTGVCVLWVLGCVAWPHAWISTMNFLIAALLLMFPAYWIEQATTARQIAEDRRDGTLELLLTTPLTPQEMVEGQASATRAQFQSVRVFIIGLCTAMMITGFFIRPWNEFALISYIILWGFLIVWYGLLTRRNVPMLMWIALNSGRSTFSVLKAHGSFWSWAWLLFQLPQAIKSFGNSAVQFPTGTTPELVVILVIGLIMFVVWLGNRSSYDYFEDMIVTEIRDIAQEPLPEANDPRFKKWTDVRTRLPAQA